VPLAKPALRLASCFKQDLFVTSYIRSGMLTHSQQEAQGYDADPLITKNISTRVLLDLADTAQRVVSAADGIDTPILMLVADKDYVVKEGPQKTYFEKLASPLKRYLKIANCHHAILYEAEQQRSQALVAAREFVQQCYAGELPSLQHYQLAHDNGPGALRYENLKAGRGGSALGSLFFGVQRRMLRAFGPVSEGMKIGLQHGFDSGASLDYVYRNQANGSFLIGKMMDRGYLDAVGWRGIRQRKQQLQQTLAQAIESYPRGQALRILDLAAGGGRYVLETVKRFQDREIELVLRDYQQGNLDQARSLADRLQLCNAISYQCRDAFADASYTGQDGKFDIVIVSGLFELFSDNSLIMRALRGLQRQLQPGAQLIYTGQPWHPQLEMIAKTLNNHQGEAWVMRPRPQVELDALFAAIGCRKLSSLVALEGIFTVSLACYEKEAASGGAPQEQAGERHAAGTAEVASAAAEPAASGLP
jgi:SAM-dependent methyltransferase